MRKLISVGIVALVVYPSAAGCGSSSSGSSCETACMAESKCPGAGMTDCSALCAAWTQISDAAMCSAEYGAVNDCYGSGSLDCQTVGSSSDPCAKYETAFETCVNPYCMMHQAQCNAANML
jgi:hypothetical protein